MVSSILDEMVSARVLLILKEVEGSLLGQFLVGDFEYQLGVSAQNGEKMKPRYPGVVPDVVAAGIIHSYSLGYSGIGETTFARFYSEIADRVSDF